MPRKHLKYDLVFVVSAFTLLVEHQESTFIALTLLAGQQEGHPACKIFAPKPLSHSTGS